MIETDGLTHIHLMVRDLERALRFYQGVFGMTERFRDGALVFLRTPGAKDTITLNYEADAVDQAGVNGGVSHFGFRLKDHGQLENAIDTVLEYGGKLVKRGVHPSGIPFAYISDPDGYLIEL